jgi:hypothetical protein
MPKFLRRTLAMIAGAGFTLFILLLSLDPRHAEAREGLPEQAHSSQPPLQTSIES